MSHPVVFFRVNPVNSDGLKNYVAWQLAPLGIYVKTGTTVTITQNATALYTFDKTGFLHAWEPDHPHVFRIDAKLNLTGKQYQFNRNQIQI